MWMLRSLRLRITLSVHLKIDISGVSSHTDLSKNFLFFIWVFYYIFLGGNGNGWFLGFVFSQKFWLPHLQFGLERMLPIAYMPLQDDWPKPIIGRYLFCSSWTSFLFLFRIWFGVFIIFVGNAVVGMILRVFAMLLFSFEYCDLFELLIVLKF